jgi:hypothetical protein
VDHLKKKTLRHLLDEVSQATTSHRIAHKAFMEIVSDLPDGLPVPDREQRITDAKNVWADARERMRVANTRLHECQTGGVIPEDLK